MAILSDQEKYNNNEYCYFDEVRKAKAEYRTIIDEAYSDFNRKVEALNKMRDQWRLDASRKGLTL